MCGPRTGFGVGVSGERIIYLEQQQLNMKMRTACHMEPRKRDVYTQNRLVSPPCAHRLSLTRPLARAATAPARGADPVLDPPRHKLTLT